jgi:phosphate transport system substrate-binding protein
MLHWGSLLSRTRPDISVQVQASGSSTASSALIAGSARIGMMSRPMREQELQAFRAAFGYLPTAIPVALDALVVYVHRDNPVRGLRLDQLDAMFSATLRCSDGRPIRYWSEVGVDGALGRRRIQLYGRNSVSGTYGFFIERVLCKGDFLPEANELPGSAAVIQVVGQSTRAIGYAGLGYRHANVRAVPLAVSEDQPCVMPDRASVISGAYPLTRYLYLYINKPPGRPLTPGLEALLDVILGREGQALVAGDGYVPLPEDVLEVARARLGLEAL